MKKIPHILAKKIAEMQSDTLYESLRRKLCNSSCSQDSDGVAIDCPECIVMVDDPVSKVEFREYLTKHGINFSVVRGG